MATVVSTQTMTLEEFNELPNDDGVDRMLIRGVLVEEPMTVRNRWHAWVEAAVARVLGNWIYGQDTPAGAVFSGEVGCELQSGETDSRVGIDVALFSTERIAEQSDDSPYIKGAPILAVEILSPSDTQERVQQKTDLYLDAGVGCVWIVDPHFRTVTVFSRGARPVMFSGDDELSGEPHLPGFTASLTDLFPKPATQR